MTLVSGPLTRYTQTPSEVEEAHIWATKVRPDGDGLMLTEMTPVEVTAGYFEEDLAPGPGVINLISGGDSINRIDVIVPDADSATLADCVRLVGLADDATRSELEKLAAEALAAVQGAAEAVREAGDALATANASIAVVEGHADRAEAAQEGAVTAKAGAEDGQELSEDAAAVAVAAAVAFEGHTPAQVIDAAMRAEASAAIVGSAERVLEAERSAGIDADRASSYARNAPITVLDFGAVAGGTTDNTKAFNDACAAARFRKAPVYVPAGRWRIDGTVNISGVTITGEMMGYQNSAGAILVGSGSNTMLKQNDFTLDSLTMSISGLRIENVVTGLDLGYMVQTTVTDVWVHSTGTGIKFGSNSAVGPLWCMFTRVIADSSGGHGMVMQGSQWCNANVFDTCEFKGGEGFAGLQINSSGGYGAVKNSFRNCEFAGNGAGVLLTGTTRSTTFSDCYMESQGPSVVSRGLTIDLHMNANVYGSTKNDVGFGPRFIDHQSGNLHLRVNGGWLVTGADPRQSGVHFVGSDNPGGLELTYTVQPHISAESHGFMLHDPTIIKTTGEKSQVAVAPTDSRIDVRRNGNLVRFRSSASVADTAVTGWVLPSWARPSATFGGPSLNQAGEIYVGSDGRVTLAGGLTGKTFRFDLTYLI